MREDMGLAEQMGGPAPQQQGQMGEQGIPQGQASVPSVNEVVALLKQGMDPEELLQKGVPMEVLKQAIEIIMQMEQQAKGVQPDSRQQMQPPQAGLGQALAQ
jgi:hypothetical protein